MKEKEISDQKSQDKEKSEQKIEETGEIGAEKATKTDDFNASLDILTAFMKDTENLLQDDKEKKEGTDKKEATDKSAVSKENEDTQKSVTETESKNQSSEDDLGLEIETPKALNEPLAGMKTEEPQNETVAIALQNVTEPEKSPEDDEDLPLPPPIDDDLNENMVDDQSAELDETNLPLPPQDSSEMKRPSDGSDDGDSE